MSSLRSKAAGHPTAPALQMDGIPATRAWKSPGSSFGSIRQWNPLRRRSHPTRPWLSRRCRSVRSLGPAGSCRQRHFPAGLNRIDRRYPPADRVNAFHPLSRTSERRISHGVRPPSASINGMPGSIEPQPSADIIPSSGEYPMLEYTIALSCQAVNEG